jgi:cold shock protein
MAVGTVKWFDRRRGFGFIQPDDGALEVFVHIAEVRSSGLTLLEDGQRVAYSLALGHQGRTSAINLKPL